MCLHKTYSKVCIRKNLSDAFLIHSVLKQYVLSPLVFSFALECAIGRIWIEWNTPAPGLHSNMLEDSR